MVSILWSLKSNSVARPQFKDSKDLSISRAGACEICRHLPLGLRGMMPRGLLVGSIELQGICVGEEVGSLGCQEPMEFRV